MFITSVLALVAIDSKYHCYLDHLRGVSVPALPATSFTELHSYEHQGHAWWQVWPAFAVPGLCGVLEAM